MRFADFFARYRTLPEKRIQFLHRQFLHRFDEFLPGTPFDSILSISRIDPKS
jgi:hypothetical protein